MLNLIPLDDTYIPMSFLLTCQGWGRVGGRLLRSAWWDTRNTSAAPYSGPTWVRLYGKDNPHICALRPISFLIVVSKQYAKDIW